MNENDIQKLTPEQIAFICSLAFRKIWTDIVFLKSKVEREDSLCSVEKTERQLIELGILQGLINAHNAFLDVYTSGIWKNEGGSEIG